MKIDLRTVLLAAGMFLIAFNPLALAHTDVTAEQARDLIDTTSDLVVVDVRELYEYCDAKGHIPGALNYPLSSGVLQARYEELTADGPILVVCRSGGRSNQAANFLDSKGFADVYDMMGGMSAWQWETVPCKYAGGNGTVEDPYQIATAEDLMLLGESPDDYDKHFILTADIDLDPNLPGRKVFDRAVIAPDTNDGEDWFQGTPFTGIFDGDGYTISNLTIEGVSCLGLFGQTDGATISDLGLETVGVNGTGDYVGALLGSNWGNGGVSNCYSTGRVSGKRWVGGLGGYCRGGSITTSYSTGTVSGDENVGGLVGHTGSEVIITESHSSMTVRGNARVGGLVGNNYADIAITHSTGSVSGLEYSVGGFVGENSGSITTSYSTGMVNGGGIVGGFVGSNWGTTAMAYSTGPVTGTGMSGGFVGWNNGSVATSYSTGAVNGAVNEKVGGFVGRNSQGSVAACFWDTENSGQTTSAGGTGLTAGEMQDIETYQNAGWDFVDEVLNGTCDYWQISPDDYPRLRYHFGESPVMPEGLGTAQEPYLIRDAGDLGTVWFVPASHYRLESSVDLSGTMWSFAVIPYFAGTFEGNGHVISNLHIQGGGNLGLFGQLDSEAIISNLGLEAVDVNGTSDYVGGLVGSNRGWITMSYTTGTVAGGSEVGGLVGMNSGDYNGNGGIANCYSTSGVSGERAVGGLVGSNYNIYYEQNGNITTSYSAGLVTGTAHSVGGLVGAGGEPNVTTSFWDVQTSGQTTSAGGMGQTTAQMQMTGAFLAWGTCGNRGIWTLDEGNAYPRLHWEQSAGVAITSEDALAGLLMGQGTPDDPYLIDTAEQLSLLNLFPCDWDKHFKLMADIDLDPNLAGGQVFDQPMIGQFSGTFDGNGCTISHLTIKGERYLGLFGLLRSGAEVKDLGLLDVNITGSGANVGGLAGANGGTIVRCYSIGTVSATDIVGGLAGINLSTGDSEGSIMGRITSCYSAGTVRGASHVGGLAGDNSSDITQCYSTALVSGTSSVGGLAGINRRDITYCYARCTVQADEIGGGLVGTNKGILDRGWTHYEALISDCYSIILEGSRISGLLVGQNSDYKSLSAPSYPALIENCYAACDGSGIVVASGLVGSNYWHYGDVFHCFWDAQACGIADDASGGMPRTTAEMHTASTFLEAGWDFIDETANGTEDIWWILEGQDYPRLWWEVMPGN